MAQDAADETQYVSVTEFESAVVNSDLSAYEAEAVFAVMDNASPEMIIPSCATGEGGGYEGELIMSTAAFRTELEYSDLSFSEASMVDHVLDTVPEDKAMAFCAASGNPSDGDPLESKKKDCEDSGGEWVPGKHWWNRGNCRRPKFS